MGSPRLWWGGARLTMGRSAALQAEVSSEVAVREARRDEQEGVTPGTPGKADHPASASLIDAASMEVDQVALSAAETAPDAYGADLHIVGRQPQVDGHRRPGAPPQSLDGAARCSVGAYATSSAAGPCLRPAVGKQRRRACDVERADLRRRRTHRSRPRRDRRSTRGHALELPTMRIIVTRTTPGLSGSQPAADQSRRCQQTDRKPPPDADHPTILTPDGTDSNELLAELPL